MIDQHFVGHNFVAVPDDGNEFVGVLPNNGFVVAVEIRAVVIPIGKFVVTVEYCDRAFDDRKLEIIQFYDGFLRLKMS